MQTILESVFLQALAYALLNSIWQMGLLWLATLLVLRIFNLSSAQKFNIAFIAQLSGFVVFIYTLIYIFNHQKSLGLFSIGNLDYIDDKSNVLKYTMPTVGLLYVIVLFKHIVKLIINYRFTQNLRKNNLVKMPAANRVFVEDLSALFSIHKKVKIYLSKTIRCPLTIGFFKPLILIPMAAVNHLTREQMEAVILHELAHIKRADYLLYLLQCVIEKIFFFNIFSKMIGDIIERERENACDDWVIQFKYNSFHYAEALLKLGRFQTSLAMAASGKKEHMLLYRIKRLIHPSENNTYKSYSSLHFSLLSLLIAAGLIISFSTKTSSGTTNLATETSKNIVPSVVNEKNYNQSFESHAIPSNQSAKKSTTQVLAEQKQAVHNTKSKSEVDKVKTETKEDEVIEPAYVQQVSPDYIVATNNTIDSDEQLSTYSDATNKQLVLSQDAYKKALSYQNFKKLESMLALTGDSITVTEDPSTRDNYKKLITIETTDKNGNKNVYKVIVELYQ
ncbi:MAG TPA: M56 family metallopeptidase [Parafilimonas sp.]|nr:M56 family metallopeptidase [Parafilimonas sp.]